VSGGPRPAQGQQLALELGGAKGATFASFVPGANAVAVAALRDLAGGRGPRQAYLHGAPGTGKSHLVQAVCAACAARGEPASGLVLGSARGHPPTLLAGLGALAVVGVDQVDAVAGERDWERALLRLYEEAQAGGARLLFTARQAPAGAGFALPDLRSRLAAGPVFRLTALDEPDRLLALRLRARERGLELGEEVAAYLLRRRPRDLATQIGLLEILDRLSLAAQRRLTVPWVRELIERGEL